MCVQDVHTTHIATNMENIKKNALLYIEHNYNRTYNYYRSIAETVAEPPKKSGPHVPTVVLTDLG